VRSLNAWIWRLRGGADDVPGDHVAAKPLLTSTIGGPDFVGCVSRRGRTLHDQPNATIAIDHRRIDFLSAMRAVVAHQIGRA
jgi:hypothetical protein